MNKLAVALFVLLAASAHAFSRVPMKMATEMSPSVPFLKKQPKLDGSMAGDVGFDPLGLSNIFDLNFMRQAEIKHGRVAMLASLGVFVQSFLHLPGEAYTEANPVDAFYKVGPAPLVQIFLFIGFLENALHDGKMTYADMDCSKPGDFGWDPAKLGSDPAKVEEMKLKEIKNGRLAMCAIGGMLHQCFVSGSPLWDFSTMQS